MRYLKFTLLSLVILTIIFSSAIFVKTIQAQNCSTSDQCQSLINQYQAKLDTVRQQKNTLSSQIEYMNTQIYLTTVKIQDTEYNIKKTGDEIETISSKIDNLNTSLDYLSRVFLKKVADGYKRREAPLIDIFLDSNNASVLNTRLKYMQVAQDTDRKIAFQVEQAKVNYQDQKKLREQKKIQLDNLQIVLNQQKANLDTQKAQKQQLLAVTQNDEATYQKLLSDAQRQLAGFKSFVQTAGGGTIGANGFGTGSDGWYYTQRDSRWASRTMGNSSDTVLEVGCLITDIAMIMKKYGSGMTPYDIASNPSYFFSNTAYLLHPSQFSWPIGLTYTNISISDINNQIQNGRPVIVGVYHGSYGTHYIILKQLDGDDYIIHDPYYGPDKHFSDLYSRSSIFVAAVFR
jgi:peptidoglycan hydrolase CwlO-like protein